MDTGISQVILAMLTSRLFRANHPSRVTVLVATPEGQQSGLIADSLVMTDNLATVDMDQIYRVIGSIPMDAVDRALRHTLGL